MDDVAVNNGCQLTRGPGSVAQLNATQIKPTGVIPDDDYKYKRIIGLLKECDPEDWEIYLKAFKKDKWTDETLQFINTNQSDDIWSALIPQLGVRMRFQQLWKQQNPTKGGPQSTNYSEGDIELAEAVGKALPLSPTSTHGINTAEAEEEECEAEGNETGNYNEPILPQMERNSNAHSVVPNIVRVESEEEQEIDMPPMAAFEGANIMMSRISESNPSSLAQCKSDDSDGMYCPGKGSSVTRGGPGGPGGRSGKKTGLHHS